MSTNNSVNFGNLPAVTVAVDDKVVISDASASGVMKTCTTQTIGDLAVSPNIKALFHCDYESFVILGDYNVSSVTDASPQFDFNFTTSISASYAVLLQPKTQMLSLLQVERSQVSLIW